MRRSGPGPAPVPAHVARLLLAFLLAAALHCGAAWAGPKFPELTGRVVDQAGVLDDGTKAELEAKSAALEKKTGTQLVVATISSLQGYDIATYGYQLGRYWGIGQKGKNNGILLIVAPNERKVRIEVGYGMEGTLTDLQSHLIIQNDVLPRFRAGDITGGIRKGFDDLVQVVSGGPLEVDKQPEKRGSEPGGFDFGSFLVLAIILGFWAFGFFGRGFGRRGPGLWIPPMGGGSFGGGGSGGGFSGGGGSFGGGGSSGSW